MTSALQSCSENVVANKQSLQELKFEIEMSQGELKLIFAPCNYNCLREQMMQKLEELLSKKIPKISLKPSVNKLYETIRKELGDEQPPALMVFGLESFHHLDRVLRAANKIRDEFRKSCRFPVVFWLNDDTVQQFIHIAPDFESWATRISFEFAKTEVLRDFLEKSANAVFSFIDNANPQKLPNKIRIFKPNELKEIEFALRDLNIREQKLPPQLEACLEFILGQNAYANQQINKAIANYEKSLNLWLKTDNLYWQGLLKFYTGLCYSRQAELEPEKSKYWEQANEALDSSINTLKQAQRLDLVARFVNYRAWGLQSLKEWDKLKLLALQSLELHQRFECQLELAQDYGFLAEVALNNSDWQEALEQSELALEALANASDQPPSQECLYRLLCAKSQRRLDKPEEALKELEIARSKSSPQKDPKLYIRILEELRSLYLDRGESLEAYRIKRELRSLQHHYKFTGFVGAEPLQPQGCEALPLELKASERDKDVNNLVDRIRQGHKLTVMYGPSGVGKSSLIYAGLIPTLKHEEIDDRDVLPVSLRVYHNWAQELGKSVAKSLIEKEVSLTTCPISADSLVEQLKQNENYNLLTVLIFDQLEEFFLIHKQQFEKQKLFDFFTDCLQIPFVHVIISIREDNLYYLLNYNRLKKQPQHILEILSTNFLYYLENFSKKKAENFIQILNTYSQFKLEPDLIQKLVEDLADGIEEIRPIEMQLVGAQLQAAKIRNLDEYEKCGCKKGLVKRFLEEIVEDCSSEAENENIVWSILNLLTSENGNRPLKSYNELALESKVEEKKLEFVLKVLEEARIVFIVADCYQLAHHYLVPFIRQNQELVWTSIGKLEQTKKELNQALKQLNQALKITEIGALNQESKSLLSNDQLGALLASIKAARKLKEQPEVPPEVKIRTICQLSNTVYSMRERNRLQKHKTEVTSLSLSKDGKLLASGSKNGMVRLWQLDGTHKEEFSAHKRKITGLSFSPKEGILASASEDGEVELWRLSENDKVKRWRLDNEQPILGDGRNPPINAVSFSPDGQTLAIASRDGKVQLCYLNKTDTKVIFNDSDFSVNNLSFSPDGQILACGCEEGRIALCYLDDGSKPKLIIGHEVRVTCLNFSPDGKKLVSASATGNLKCWDVKNREIQERHPKFPAHQKWITSVSFSPDGQTIASASLDGTVKLWNSENLKQKQLLPAKAKDEQVNSICFSPDGKTLASADNDGTVRLWALKFNEPQICSNEDTKVTSICFSPDDRTLAFADKDGKVKLWHRDTQKVDILPAEHPDEVTRISFSPDGQILVSADRSKNAKLWLLNTDETFNPLMLDCEVTSISWSRDSQSIAFAARDGTIEIWSRNNFPTKTVWKLKTSWKQNIIEPVISISFSDDRTILTSVKKNGKIQVWFISGTSHFYTLAILNGSETLVFWLLLGMILQKRDAPSLKREKTFQSQSKEITSASFSPDGQTIALAGEDGTIEIWSRDVTKRQIFKGVSKKVTSLSFSPDGKILASAIDNNVIIWSLNGIQLHTLEGHRNPIVDLSFSRDGQTLASADKGGKTILWNLNLDDLLKRARNWVKDYLKTNPNERQKDLDL